MLPSVPKVIYLDQNGWIDLANSSRETIDFFANLSESGAAIFPLSIVHLVETSKDHDAKRRQERASLMIRISKGYCFLPYVDQIIKEEIRMEVLRRCGLPKIDLRKYVLKKGICHMIGVKPTIVKRKGSKAPDQPPDDVKEKMNKFLDAPQAMLAAFLTPHDHDLKIRQMYEKTVEKMEQDRRNSLKIRDKTIRQNVIFGKFMIDLIGPMVAKVLTELNVPREGAFFKNWTKRDFEEFIDQVPTARCLFTLIRKR